MEYISFQQIRQIRDAGYHNRCQPNGIRSKIDIRNQVLVRQHRQYDTTDSKEFRQRNHFIILHTLSKFGKRMFQFGQKKHRHNHHDVKPGRLSGYDRSHAIGNQRNNNGSNTKNMKLRLLDVIVQPQQQSQHCTTSHKQTHIGRVEYIEQIPQDSDKSKCTVGPEKGSFTLTLQTDSALRKPD